MPQASPMLMLTTMLMPVKKLLPRNDFNILFVGFKSLLLRQKKEAHP